MSFQKSYYTLIFISSFFAYSLRLVASAYSLRLVASANCTCDPENTNQYNKNVTLKYKLGAIAAILVASALGVSLPIIGKKIPALHPESNLFFLVRSFAAGVILSTGFIHILPDAFDDLSNPCLTKSHPWSKYSAFPGLFAMIGALGSLMIDAFATGYYRRVHYSKPGPSATVDEEINMDHSGHVHLHSHGSHGHAHGPAGPGATASHVGLNDLDRIRYKVTSQGVGLAGCIVQASFKSASTLCMALFFSLTTPVGIAIGIPITNTYNEDNPSTLIIQGTLNSIAAGILIYMALVDLLAQDFMNPKVQTNTKLFLGANITLLLGAGFMAALAYWA